MPDRRPLRLFLLSLGLLICSALAGKGQTIEFTSPPPTSTPLGVAYIYDANATASNGSQVRYSLRFGPSGMSVNPRTGVVAWNPTQPGDYHVEIRAELVDDPSINLTLEWTITVSQTQVHPGCTGNELWLPVERGLPGISYAAATLGNELYILHQAGPDPDDLFQLSKWNGSYWTLVSTLDPNFGSDFRENRPKMVAYKGELYVSSGISLQNTLVSPVVNLTKWDGTNWSAVGTNDFRQIADMEVIGDELYILGFHEVNSKWLQALARWNGTDWEIIVDGTDILSEWRDWGVALATLNDKLYVACRPGMLDIGWDELPLVVLDGGTLKSVDNKQLDFANDYRTLDVIPHNGALIFMTDYQLMQWDGSKVEVMNIPPGKSVYNSNRSAISYNGDLYVGTWLANGPVPVVLDHQIWRYHDNTWLPISNVLGFSANNSGAHLNFNFVEYNGSLYSYGCLSQSCEVAVNNIAMLGTEAECARISGSVYHDDDRSCSVDPNELLLNGELIEILPGPFYALTDIDGKFSTLLRPGTYSLSVMPKHNWMNSCLLPTEVTLASAAAAVDNVDIGTDMIPGIYDVRSSIAVGRARPGFDVPYTLTYWNAGTEPATGKLIFEYDGRLVYNNSTTAPARHNGNVMEWDFANLPVGASISITVNFILPSTMELGTRLCAFLDVELEKPDDDEFLGDNDDSVCVEVRGSYDPNDIQVAPIRFDEELSDAPLLPGDTVLSYLVRFQNTGTDTAVTVIVSDTLDATLLDIPSIQLGAASHGYDFDVSGPGILTWTFRDIMLPDSGVNEPASHGYFKYAIHLRRGLMPMTEIPNRASIYFDYNVPVITNTVVSITSGTLGVQDAETTASSLQIYPNPVLGTSSISLNMAERQNVTLKLINSRGEILAVLNDGELPSGEHNFKLDGRSLAAGAYYLVLDRGGVKELYPVVIAK